jgi:competence protein ComEC
VLLVAPREPKFNYGDRLAVQGELVEPENFVTDTGREFDYVGYLAKDDIFHLIYQPELKLLARGEGNLVIEKLLALKGWFTTGLALTLPEPHGSLAAGLTVGARRGLSEEWLAALRRTGIIHIVVLSGYNLTIVAEALIRLFTFAPFFWRFGLGVVGIWLFALMTGAGASVMRASLMATIALVARVTGRVYHATTALGVAAALMIWWEPRILIWDVGFQLSILATFGLIHGTPKLAPYFRWLRWPASPRASLGGSWLRELAAATAATQIFVLPWLLYQIGELSLVALPVNLLVVALVPATMLATFLAGTVAGVSTVLAWPFSAAAYLLLTYELAVVRFFNWLPLAAISIPYFPFLAVLLAYAAIYRWWFGRRKIKVKI